MWPQPSHVLALLTALSGSIPYMWTPPACAQAFKKTKVLLAHNIINIFPDLNIPLTYNNTSDYQLGAEILQEPKPSTNIKHPSAYYWSSSKKLDEA